MADGTAVRLFWAGPGVNLLTIAARLAAETVSRIRSKGAKFDLAEFKELESAEEMQAYAHMRLQPLGRGSSRAVYSLTGTKVLKIAASGGGNVVKGRGGSEAGVAQNKAEVDVYTDPKTRDAVAKIFDFDPEYRWLISEAVRSLSESEFESLAGTGVEDLRKTVEFCVETDSSAGEGVEWAEEQWLSPPKREVLDLMLHLVDVGLAYGDLMDPEHWGKTPDNRLVLLDYGFTKGVADEYYSSPGSSAGTA